jgi:hypothetical protein
MVPDLLFRFLFFLRLKLGFVALAFSRSTSSTLSVGLGSLIHTLYCLTLFILAGWRFYGTTEGRWSVGVFTLETGGSVLKMLLLFPAFLKTATMEGTGNGKQTILGMTLFFQRFGWWCSYALIVLVQGKSKHNGRGNLGGGFN